MGSEKFIFPIFFNFILDLFKLIFSSKKLIFITKFSNSRLLISLRFIFKFPLKFKSTVLFELYKFINILFKTVWIRTPDKIKFKSKKNGSNAIFPVNFDWFNFLLLLSKSSIVLLLNL